MLTVYCSDGSENVKKDNSSAREAAAVAAGGVIGGIMAKVYASGAVNVPPVKKSLVTGALAVAGMGFTQIGSSVAYSVGKGIELTMDAANKNSTAIAADIQDPESPKTDI